MLSRQVARHNVTINGLLPGRFETDRSPAILTDAAEQAGRTLEEEIEGALPTIPAGRFGHLDECGGACSFFCGSQAGYLTGPNIVLDGGAFPGVL